MTFFKMSKPSKHHRISLSELPNEPQYCEIVERNCPSAALPEQETFEKKINELLVRVRRIDVTLLEKPLTPTPRVPPKPSQIREVTLSSSSATDSSSEQPPPRPPRTIVASPRDERMFRRSECEYLLAQVENIRYFMDTMIDDDFDGKQDTMLALKTLKEGLTFR